jgi:sporulation protein YunB
MIIGNISTISTNVVTVNGIISDIALKIQEELEKEENNSINVRLGSLTGAKIFAGRGPNIKIKIETSGSIDTELKSEFETAGINQTLHRLYLQIDCNVIILTPFKTIEDKIVNQVLLSEAVIVGTTPSTYYNVEITDKNE